MRHPWKLGAAWGCACLASLASSPDARAAEPSRAIALEWSAPAGCPDESWARKAIDAYLGHRARDSFKPIDVHVDIMAIAGGRWRADLSVGGGATGSRVFEGSSCARVGDAAVLIVALMLDPVEVVTQMDAPRDDLPHTSRATPEGARVVDARAGTRVELSVEATGDVGSLPEPTVGAGVAAGLRSGRLSIQMDLLAWIPRRAFGGPTPASGGEIGLYTASLRGCIAAWRGLGIAIEPCVRGEGGLSKGTGFGVAEPVTSQKFWGAAFA